DQEPAVELGQPGETEVKLSSLGNSLDVPDVVNSATNDDARRCQLIFGCAALEHVKDAENGHNLGGHRFHDEGEVLILNGVPARVIATAVNWHKPNRSKEHLAWRND